MITPNVLDVSFHFVSFHFVFFVLLCATASDGDDGASEGQHCDADVRGESHLAGSPGTDGRARATGTCQAYLRWRLSTN